MNPEQLQRMINVALQQGAVIYLTAAGARKMLEMGLELAIC
jgi:hypothetical protein